MSSAGTTEPSGDADGPAGAREVASALVDPVLAPPPTIVVGIGNPILGDDGIGWQVVEEVERRWAADHPASTAPTVSFTCLSVGGLSLMERLVGARRAILVDAVKTGDRPIGTLLVMPLAELVPGVAGHLDNPHDASLPVAIAAGRSLGADLPTDITVVGVEAEWVDIFGEDLTPPVAAAVEPAVRAVLDLLARGGVRRTP